jgi:RNA polymerase sigma-70 factor (ECF subfamily)
MSADGASLLQQSSVEEDGASLLPPGGSPEPDAPSGGPPAWPDPKQAFERIYRAYFSGVLYLFIGWGFSREDARDLAQETFVRVYGSMGTLQRESALKAWIQQIAANVYRNRLRDAGTKKRKGNEVSLDGVAEGTGVLEDRRMSSSPEQGPLHRILAEERQALLRQSLAELPPQRRLCVILRLEQEMKYKDIAVLLGVSIDTVKAHLHQAKQQLRSRLEHELGGFEALDPGEGEL